MQTMQKDLNKALKEQRLATPFAGDLQLAFPHKLPVRLKLHFAVMSNSFQNGKQITYRMLE
jgi:hypothetical protein